MSNWCHFTYVEHSCYDSTQRLSIHINPFYAAIHTSHPYSKIPKIRDTRDPRAQMLLTGYMFHDPGALCFPNHCSLFIVRHGAVIESKLSMQLTWAIQKCKQWTFPIRGVGQKRQCPTSGHFWHLKQIFRRRGIDTWTWGLPTLHSGVEACKSCYIFTLPIHLAKHA